MKMIAALVLTLPFLGSPSPSGSFCRELRWGSLCCQVINGKQVCEKYFAN